MKKEKILILLIFITTVFSKSYYLEKKNFTSRNKSKSSMILDLDTLCTFGDNADVDILSFKKNLIALYNNLYIFFVDQRRSKVYRFSCKNRNLQTFCDRGQGPGEADFITSIFIQNDSLCVVDSGNKRISKFSLDGNFIRQSIYDSEHPPYIYTYNKNQFISSTVKVLSGYVDEKLKSIYKYYIEIFDSNLNFKKRIIENMRVIEDDTVYDRYGSGYIVALTDSFFVATEFSKDVYKIQLYDHEGNKLSTISKDYRKEKLSLKELEEFKIIMKKYDYKSIEKLKPSLYDLSIDKYSNIWVKRTNNELEKYDIFVEGIFVDTILLNNAIFINEKILVKDKEGLLYLCNYELSKKKK